MDSNIIVLITIFFFLESVLSYCPAADHWSGWWGYDGYASGPSSWGDHNEDWVICKTGKNQSPIDIKPQTLLFDPQLQPFKVDTASVSGTFRNNKRDLTLLVNNSSPAVNFTAGPLSYTYRLYQIKLHFGRENVSGSEHHIDGRPFAGELQFMAYNSDLYANHSVAQVSPRGVAIVAVFISVGDYDNSAFQFLQEKFYIIDQQDSCTDVEYLPVDKLLPESLDHYMTYAGSLTQPSCRETVTWIILNKPMYISSKQMTDLRRIPYQEWRFSNARPLMPLNRRTIRTNINFRNQTRLCSMEIAKRYIANPDVGLR
ncbi:carbonic anhydrase-related protein 10-like [Mya arenaria]|uniref:carbonic anhydrase-related protein 10-like n=1 Tax=Mya arenaria TaxID=6604 RepID=UPI0022E6E5AD|nr:carbonic anhydrase-related protein 10-like [Mya arenaria]